jgi:hypothetical protein
VPIEELVLHGTGLNKIVVPWSVEGFGALAFILANHFSRSTSNQFRGFSTKNEPFRDNGLNALAN